MLTCSSRDVLLSITILVIFVVPIHAFPGAAGHCSSGDLSGKFSGHGENGGGPLSQGSLRIRFDSTTLQTSTTIQLNANQVYTITLDFANSSSNFFFRGLLFRLSGKNGENVEGTLWVGSDNNVQLKSDCAPGISAVTHNSRVDKTSTTFEFEYAGSTGADLLLEVTVVRERMEDNWFYSSYNLEIVGSSPTKSPMKSPTISPTTIPTKVPTKSPTSPPTKVPTKLPTKIPTTSPTPSPTRSPIASPTKSPIIQSPTNAPNSSKKTPTQSPTKRTEAPTTSVPTKKPTIKPSIPSRPPTSPISYPPDSPLRFRTQNIFTNQHIWRSCSWVASKFTKLRCTWKHVSSMCPTTCHNNGNDDDFGDKDDETKETCLDGMAKFKLMFNDKMIRKTCEWVGKRSTRYRCAADGVKETCRETCGRCGRCRLYS